MPSIKISDSELALLDGKCSEEVQVEVDAAKARLEAVSELKGVPEKIAGFIADVVREAQESGRIVLQHTRLNSCKLCSKSAGYAKYPRSGRYHRKGDTNYSKPLSFGGYDLKESFVHIKGYASLGGCYECIDAALPALREKLKGVSAEIPETLMGHASKFKKWDKCKCSACEWEGHEGELGQLQTMMGDGYYRGKCPSCGAENQLFSSPVKTVPGHVVLPVECPLTP